MISSFKNILNSFRLIHTVLMLIRKKCKEGQRRHHGVVYELFLEQQSQTDPLLLCHIQLTVLIDISKCITEMLVLIFE